MLSDSTVNNLYSKTKKIQYSRIYLIIAISLVSLISILQIVNFSLSYKNGNPNYVNTILFGDSNSLFIVTIISLTVTTIAAPLGVLSSINLGKGNRSFFWYVSVQFSMYVLNSILLGLWYNAAVFTIAIFLCLRMYLNWNDSETEGKPYNSIGYKKLIFLLFALVILIIGLGFVTFYTYWNFSLGDGIKVVIPFMDASVLITTLVGFTLISFHNKEAYLFYYIGNISNMILLALLGQWNIFFLTIIVMFNDFLGLVSWENNYRKSAKS